MKQFISSVFILFFLLTLVVSSCVPAPTPVPSTLTSTATQEPSATVTATATRAPSPTPVPPVWNVNMQIDAPLVFEERRYGYSYNYEEIPNSGIFPNTATRWTIDMQVDELPGATGGETSTGLLLEGYTEDGQVQRLDLIYANGIWYFAYAGSSTKQEYYQEFRDLEAPAQHFEIVVDDGNLAIRNQDRFLKGLTGTDLFGKSKVINASLLIGPRRQLTVSSLRIEQLQVPSEGAAPIVSLEKPYIVGFEDLDPSQPTEISPFVFPERNDIFGIFKEPWQRGLRTVPYLAWVVDARARSGSNALNVIPNGNPITKGMTPVTIASLQPVFDVTGHDTVTLKLWFNSTSNPSKRSIHNCESDLAIYARLDTGSWTQYRVICGEHKSESQGWQNTFVDVDVSGKSTIQFAFVYEVQDAKQPDPDVYFLIDDIEITAK